MGPHDVISRGAGGKGRDGSDRAHRGTYWYVITQMQGRGEGEGGEGRPAQAKHCSTPNFNESGVGASHVVIECAPPLHHRY